MRRNANNLQDSPSKEKKIKQQKKPDINEAH